MKIIPAIDIIDGQCVRLTKGDYTTKKVYNANPIEVAKAYEDHGIKYLHLVDLDGAKAKRIVNYKVLEQICKQTDLNVDWGGGIRSDEDIQKVIGAGASQVTVGSIAAVEKEKVLLWLLQYSQEKIILGADCKNRMIATNGWTEDVHVDVVKYIREYESSGIKDVICTDIAKDGMLAGCALALYKEILDSTTVNLIASGGVSSIEDLKELKAIGCYGAIIGKAIYENKITLKELSRIC